jgi:hypothetical protein
MNRLVILESPFAGTSDWRIIKALQCWLNKRYARKAMFDSLCRSEAPMVSHLLYTQVLDDNIPYDRGVGIDAGLAWRRKAEATVVYADRGISRGMQYGIDMAKAQGLPVEIRYLYRSVHDTRG